MRAPISAINGMLSVDKSSKTYELVSAKVEMEVDLRLLSAVTRNRVVRGLQTGVLHSEAYSKAGQVYAAVCKTFGLPQAYMGYGKMAGTYSFWYRQAEPKGTNQGSLRINEVSEAMKEDLQALHIITGGGRNREFEPAVYASSYLYAWHNTIPYEQVAEVISRHRVGYDEKVRDAVAMVKRGEKLRATFNI